MDFTTQFREWIARSGLSKKELYKSMGISRASFDRYEKGQIPKKSNLERILRYFEIKKDINNYILDSGSSLFFFLEGIDFLAIDFTPDAQKIKPHFLLEIKTSLNSLMEKKGFKDYFSRRQICNAIFSESQSNDIFLAPYLEKIDDAKAFFDKKNKGKRLGSLVICTYKEVFSLNRYLTTIKLFDWSVYFPDLMDPNFFYKKSMKEEKNGKNK